MNRGKKSFACRMQSFKEANLISAVLAILIFFSYGCSDEQGAGGGFSMPPTPVEAATANAQKIVDRFESVGTIEASEVVTVVSEIDAIIVSLPFAEGEAIKRGGLIAKLDGTQLAAEVARTEALRDQSFASFNRIKTIVDLNAGSQQDLDDAAAALKVAEANLELAKANYNKTKITAPFSGVIGSRKVSVGTFLRVGQPIAELANIDDIRVNFSVPERFIAKLNRGAKVNVSTTAYPGYNVKGEIKAIEPVLDPISRNVRVVAQIPNEGQKFRSGMSANVSAVLSEINNAITVPNEAVFANGNQSFVYVIKPDSTVTRAAVTLGLQMADMVEVVDGLEPDQQIVKAGHQKLYEGAKVMPINSN